MSSKIKIAKQVTRAFYKKQREMIEITKKLNKKDFEEYNKWFTSTRAMEVSNQ